MKNINKMRKFLIAILMLQVGNLYAQNPFWEAKDKKLIKEIVELVDSPQALDKYFSARDTFDLGFDYHLKQGYASGGYISIRCDLYFYKGSLISYVLRPELPEKKRKRKKYLKWYNGQFEVTGDMAIKPKYYNYDIIKKPLQDYNRKWINDEQISYYMSPESGLLYGGRGGFSNNLLRNRALFIELKDKLDKEVVIQLMYSKNPASRLTAIEYYYKNPDLFIQEKEELDKWIEIIFEQSPNILTMDGCFVKEKKSKKITQQYSKINIR